jgi:lipopolysaccharide assembly outer membrane protein LptD (OstA)
MQSEVFTGQLEIVGDRNEYTKDGIYFIAAGNVYVAIGGQDSRLTADKVVYNLSKQILDAAGNVRIEREGTLTTGSRFKFWVAHPGYLITNATTKVIDMDGKLIRERVAIKSADSNTAGDGYVFYSSNQSQDGRIDQFLHGKGNSLEGDFNQSTSEKL